MRAAGSHASNSSLVLPVTKKDECNGKHTLGCSSWSSLHVRVQGSHGGFCADWVHIFEFVHSRPRCALLLLPGTCVFCRLACVNGFPQNRGSCACRNFVRNEVEASTDDIGFVDEKNRGEGQNVRFRGVLIQRAAVDDRYGRIMPCKRDIRVVV